MYVPHQNEIQVKIILTHWLQNEIALDPPLKFPAIF